MAAKLADGELCSMIVVDFFMMDLLS